MPVDLRKVVKELREFRFDPKKYPQFRVVVNKKKYITASPGIRMVQFKGLVKGETNDYLNILQFFETEFAEEKDDEFKHRANLKGKDVYFRDLTVNAVKLKCQCFTGDTLISLADGYSVPIKDLVNKEEFFVYSYDRENDKVVIGRGYNCEVKEQDAPLLKVTFDNGNSVRCTPDHKFLLKTGEYREAQDLKEGDSIEPLYRSLTDDYPVKDYEQVYQGNGDWQTTHSLADEYNLKHKVYEKSSGTVRHHKDFDKYNNQPDNIVRMSWSDHKIAKVEEDGNEDVYCFTVEDYGNFAIDIDNGKKHGDGLFVKNCPDFRHRFEKQLFDEKGLVGTFRRYTPVPGSNRGPVNPKDLLGYCKHINSFLRAMDRSGFFED